MIDTDNLREFMWDEMWAVHGDWAYTLDKDTLVPVVLRHTTRKPGDQLPRSQHEIFLFCVTNALAAVGFFND